MKFILFLWLTAERSSASTVSRELCVGRSGGSGGVRVLFKAIGKAPDGLKIAVLH